MLLYTLIPILLIIFMIISLGSIETLILLSAILFSSIIYTGVICLQDDNKCLSKTNSGYQMMLPIMGYVAPFENLKKNGFGVFLQNLISFRAPYIYNLIGLIVGLIFVYAYKIGEEKEVNECSDQKKEIIDKIKIAKAKNNATREKEDEVMEEKMNLLRERESNLLEEVKENEENKKAIRNEILKLVNVEEELN